MKRLGNQIAVVTGMSSGKGRAIMLALAESGAKLLCSGSRASSRHRKSCRYIQAVSVAISVD